MPSPLNTPTNEILPNQLPTGISGLEWHKTNSNTINDMEDESQRLSAKRGLTFRSKRFFALDIE